MQQKINRSIRWMSFSVALWLLATPAMAQGCQVVVSQPEVQLGKQRYSAGAATLFARQELTVMVQCTDQGPVTLLIDGTPDAGGQRFRFGTAAGMTLSLVAAQYDGADTALRLASAQQGERRVSAGEPVQLSPGSQLTTLAAGDAGKESHLLQLRLRLDFPATGNEGRVRDLTELAGQVRFEARQ